MFKLILYKLIRLFFSNVIIYIFLIRTKKGQMKMDKWQDIINIG